MSKVIGGAAAWVCEGGDDNRVTSTGECGGRGSALSISRHIERGPGTRTKESPKMFR